MRPKTIHLYINQRNIVDFDEADDLAAIQTIELSKGDWDPQGTANKVLNFRNRKISSLVVFVAKGDGDGDKTRLDRIKLVGVQGMPMKIDQNSIEETYSPNEAAKHVANVQESHHETAEVLVHLLQDRSESLAADPETWKDLLIELPDYLRTDVECSKVFSRLIWTCTPRQQLSPGKIPLYIAGAPVIIPVRTYYPLLPTIGYPADPYPTLLDPSAPLDDLTISSIFQTFKSAQGFFLLLNGMLQLIVPEDFNYRTAMETSPCVFGGLRVNYIPMGMIPTGGKKQLMETVSQITVGDAIEIRVAGRASKPPIYGRIGVKAIARSSEYLITSTHIIQEACIRSTSGFFKKRGTETDVEVFHSNEKIGKFSHRFDSELQDKDDYPNGYTYDISLVESLTKTPLNIVSPLQNLSWGSRERWNKLREKLTNLKVLFHNDHDGKTIPSASISDCVIVGMGAWGRRNEQEVNKRAMEMSKFLLYRVLPEFDPSLAISGLAIYTESEGDQGRTKREVVGFQSFAHYTNYVPWRGLDHDDPKFRTALESGTIAFYGAFEIPDELRKYKIG